MLYSILKDVLNVVKTDSCCNKNVDKKKETFQKHPFFSLLYLKRKERRLAFISDQYIN